MEELKMDIPGVAKTLRLPQETIIELVGELLDSKDTFIDDLRKAIEKGDSECIRTEAHKLKGASLNLRVNTISRLALTMENAARNGEDIDFTSLLNEIENEFDAVRSFLKNNTANHP